MKNSVGLRFSLVRLAGVLLGALLIPTGCKQEVPGSPTVKSIQVMPASPSVAKGTSEQLTATAIWTDNVHSDVTSVALWSSSNANTATVGAGTGMVRGAAVGGVTITASFEGQSGTATVTVTSATLVSIALTPPTATLALGTSQQLIATGTFSDGTIQDVSADVSWSTSAAAVSSVSSSGLVQSLGVGSSTITATCAVASVCGTVSGSSTLTVTSAVLQSIAVTPPAPTVGKGLTQSFTATGLYSDGTKQNLTSTVTWTSDNTAIATIDSKGVANAVAVGAVNITAGLGTLISARVPLTVSPALLRAIQIDPVASSIALGTMQRYTATGVFTDNTTADLTAAVVWSSSNAGVASISNAPHFGRATAVGIGSTTISAALSDLHSSVSLTVTPAELELIEVTPSLSNIARGLTEQFTATGLYTDGTHQNLTDVVVWSSSDIIAAPISNAAGSNGLASALNVGFTFITARLGTTQSRAVPLTIGVAALASIAVTPTSASIPKGLTQQFTAMATFTDGWTQDMTRVVGWQSSNTSSAAVSSAFPNEGLATALGTGNASISAMYGGIQSNQTALTISPATLVSIAISAANPSVVSGLSDQITATGTYTDGSTQDLTSHVTWASDTPSVATISNAASSHGLVTGVAVGRSEITATLGSITSSPLTLSVTPATLISIAITPPGASFANGTTQQFTSKRTY